MLNVFGNSVRTHASMQAILFVSIFFSTLNIAYTITVVAVVRSWLLTWWVDRRFPFCLIPLWVFLLFSIALLILGIYFYPNNRPKLRFDRINKLLIFITFGIFVWIILALSLTHTMYIGDFNVLHMLQNVFSGRSILELPLETIDIFPTLGDTILIGYILCFLFLFLASWRAFRTVRKTMHFFVLGKPNLGWQSF